MSDRVKGAWRDQDGDYLHVGVDSEGSLAVCIVVDGLSTSIELDYEDTLHIYKKLEAGLKAAGYLMD